MISHKNDEHTMPTIHNTLMQRTRRLMQRGAALWLVGAMLMVLSHNLTMWAASVQNPSSIQLCTAQGMVTLAVTDGDFDNSNRDITNIAHDDSSCCGGCSLAFSLPSHTSQTQILSLAPTLQVVSLQPAVHNHYYNGSPAHPQPPPHIA